MSKKRSRVELKVDGPSVDNSKDGDGKPLISWVTLLFLNHRSLSSLEGGLRCMTFGESSHVLTPRYPSTPSILPSGFEIRVMEKSWDLTSMRVVPQIVSTAIL